ncbi:unnamed protein product, partial [Laminaria digitata]
ARQDVASAEALRDASQELEIRRKAELVALSESVASAERDSQAATLAIARAQEALEAARALDAALQRDNAAPGAISTQAAAGASSVSPSALGRAQRASRTLSPPALGKAAAASALASVFSVDGRRASPAPVAAISSPDPTSDGSRAVPATSAALAARLGLPPVSALPPPGSVSITGHPRGDNAFLEGSVACMATEARQCFTADAAEAVVHHARVVLSELPATPPLSVGDLWTMRSGGCWEEQRCTEHIMQRKRSFGPPRPCMRPTWAHGDAKSPQGPSQL